MYESIAYNKDLITGTEILLPKKKRVTPVRGSALVELFTDGKKEYEAYTENVICDILSRFAYMDYYYNAIKSIPTVLGYTSPFIYMILTDYNGPEAASNLAILGNIVGYAHKVNTYVGADSQKGTINLAETTLDATGDGTLHFVFDFPTNAANGTFQTISWAPSVNNSGSGYFSAYTVVSTGITLTALSTLAYDVCIALPNGNLALILFKTYSSAPYYQSGTVGYCLIVDPTNNCAVIKTYNLQTKLGSNFAGSTTAVGNSDLNNIVFFTVTGIVAILNTDTDTVTYVTSGLVASSSFRLIQCAGYLFMQDSNSSTSLYKFSYSGGVATKLMTYLSPNMNYYCLKVFNGIPYFATSIGDNYIIKNDVVIKSLNNLASAESIINTQGKIYADASVITNDGSQWSVTIRSSVLSASLGAQTLLAAPITKAPTNTMKIQYDFKVTKVL